MHARRVECNKDGSPVQGRSLIAGEEVENIINLSLCDQSENRRKVHDGVRTQVWGEVDVIAR